MTPEEVAYAQGKDAAREVVADWMGANGFATGHGDTLADLLSELKLQISEEYERGKRHGADDRKMIEQRNKAQGREIDLLKGEIAKLKKDAWTHR
jgi:hypothetical protein